MTLKEQLARERAKKAAKLAARAARREATAPSRRFPPGLDQATRLAWLASEQDRLRERGLQEEVNDYEPRASWLPTGDPRPYSERRRP